MAKNIYTFPAVFTYEENGISVDFPDLPGCLTCADTTEEALRCAEEVLGLVLVGREEDNEEIPEPTPLEKIQCEHNQRTVLVTTYMPLARHEVETFAVKKTLTIPQWLNKLAEEKKVNFSQVLQAALKEQLGIKDIHS